MRISNRSTLLLLACVLAVSTSHAESAKSLYHKGQQAEARQNYLEAYEAYKAAYDEKPTDLRYRSSFERMKFQAAAVHVKHGQQLRQNGELEKALQEFQTAAQIDPSSFIAQQEITRTKAQIAAATGQGNTSQQEPKRDDILRQRIEQAQGPVALAPINDLSINMHISGDSKTIYQTIGKLAGVNILFDPDYVARQLPALELNGVTLQEALSIVSIQSGTFWRPVTPNTIFVAPNTQTKRKDLDQSVVKTFYLTNANSQTEFQDIANTLRTILDITRVQPIAAENALVVRGTPDQVALASKIVGDLDKSRAEVVVDVAILQVSREKMRNLGFTPSLANGPIGIQLIPPGQTTTTNPNANNGQQQSTTTSNNGLTLNTFAHLNATDFAVSVPQAQLNALFSDSDTKLLQNPEIRASDGQKASLKIGSRIPIATGSFQPGIGGVGINPLVNTQFQYLDVGVNIDVQPTVHLNGDVTLKVTMDISSQTNTVSIGGIDQPVISQRKIDHQIRLREGEVNLMGGIFEDQDQKNYTGIPGLGQVPILKYIFGSQKIDHLQNEVVFVLIPHLVRDQDVTDLNLRPIDVGTGTGIELRVTPNRPGRGGQGEAPSPQGQLQQQQPRTAAPSSTAALSNPAAAPAPTVGGVQVPPPQSVSPATTSSGQQSATPSGQAVLRFDPASITTTNGGTFTVGVTMNGGADVASVPLQITYDPKHLSVVKIDNGDFLTKDGQPVALVNRDDVNTGVLVASASRPPGSGGVSGQGTVFTVTLQAKQPGDTVISITRPGARNSQQQPIQVLGSQMTVKVQ
ncbi:MAG TPA: cohesin domain-containing protein [Terriglobales bacterium]|nr:cohesin domain-containing protein [Terriglobales bacterium]